jgi:hypothetical protein
MGNMGMCLQTNPVGRGYGYVRDWVIMATDGSVCAMRSCRDRDTAWNIFLVAMKFILSPVYQTYMQYNFKKKSNICNRELGTKIFGSLAPVLQLF